ncbi:MAG: COX15/CtaA family protein, partial [Myxococcales bacterium]|nr:COX15/CtaA family protein [Myxococcales bacterium]
MRITGSGAGCGRHWPDCDGTFIPWGADPKKLIEYTHRSTTGLLGIFGVLFVGWNIKRYKKGAASWAAIVTFVWILIEAAIGAGLVLKELVENDDSVARAVVIALHLVNTLVLTGACAITVWVSRTHHMARRWRWRNAGGVRWILVLGLLGIAVTSASGAVTALGDTLFPVDPSAGAGLVSRLRDDLSPANHFLVRLRVIHPVVATVVALFLVYVANHVRTHSSDRESVVWSQALLVVTVLNVLLGLSNILLHAPGWIQLTHLLIAQLVWITCLFTSRESNASEARTSRSRPNSPSTRCW